MNNIYVFITVFLSEYNDMCNLQASLSVLNFKYTHVLCFNGVQIVSENLDIKWMKVASVNSIVNKYPAF